MSVIVPALLAPTPEDLARQLEKVGPLSPLLSYDVADGVLVAPASPWPGEYPQPPDGTAIFWHLMVKDPIAMLPACLRFPTKMVALHVEADGLPNALDQLQNGGVPMGLALNPETPVSAVEPWLERLDFVQLMTVEPGGQGRPFLMKQLEKIAELRVLRPELQIAVDGGVSRATIQEVGRHNVDYIVVGSALLAAEDPVRVYEELQGAIS